MTIPHRNTISEIINKLPDYNSDYASSIQPPIEINSTSSTNTFDDMIRWSIPHPAVFRTIEPRLRFGSSIYNYYMPEDVYKIKMKKPSFIFENTKRYSFDLEKTYVELFELISQFKGSKFIFSSTFKNKFGSGPGANRQVYLKIANEILNELFIKTSSFFVDINLDNIFWDFDENITNFVIFIALLNECGCFFPMHFHPILLEKISCKEMSYEELDFFVEKLDPDLYNNAKKIDQKDFNNLNIGYSTINEYFRYCLTNTLTNKKLEIYEKISNCFEMFDSFNDFDILTIDKTFSGNYEFSHEDILKNMILSDPSYINKWSTFVKSLNQQELKQMLLTFGNSLSQEKKIFININDQIDTDLHISTCSYSIEINKNLFDNSNYLNNLKIYFSDSDSLSDGYAGTELEQLVNDNNNFTTGSIWHRIVFPLGQVSVSETKQDEPVLNLDSSLNEPYKYMANKTYEYTSSSDYFNAIKIYNQKEIRSKIRINKKNNSTNYIKRNNKISNRQSNNINKHKKCFR